MRNVHIDKETHELLQEIKLERQKLDIKTTLGNLIKEAVFIMFGDKK